MTHLHNESYKNLHEKRHRFKTDVFSLLKKRIALYRAVKKLITGDGSTTSIFIDSAILKRRTHVTLISFR